MATNSQNLFVPAVVAPYIAAELSAKNAVVLSGAAVVSPSLAAKLAGGSNTFTIPFWNELDTVGLVPNTNFEDKASVQKVSAGSQVGVRLSRTIKPFAVTELEALMTGEDPVGAAAAQIAYAHQKMRQASLMAMLAAVTGVDSGDAGTLADLAYDGTAGVFSATSLIKGVQAVWGDRGDAFGNTLFVNSATYATMQIDQLNSVVSSRAGVDVGFGTYLGNSIVRDDAVPVGKTYVVRRGGIAFASGTLPNSFAVARDEFAGGGIGADVVHSRDLFAFHVAGTSFTGSLAGEIATDAELATVAKWSLVKPAKQVGVMVIAHQ